MLHIQYIPSTKIHKLNNQERVDMIISLLKSGKIVIIDGRLSSSDEALLIRKTMSSIDDEFNGIEIGVMRDHDKADMISRIKYRIAKALIGDRSGLTIIGPARIISELRQNPETIELCFQKEYLLKHSKNNVKKTVRPFNMKIL